MRQILFFLTLSIVSCTSVSVSFSDSPSNPPPGVIIATSPDFQKIYIGSPSIAELPDGSYVASNDWFGPGATLDSATVYSSKDKGTTWSKICDIKGLEGANLFVHKENLYLFGCSRLFGNLVIRRSLDGGKTWTEPKDSQTGLLRKGNYHISPCPILIHQGKIWRAFEYVPNTNVLGGNNEAIVGSVPVDADLLDASQWTYTNSVPYNKNWGGAAFLEGNVLVSPKGDVVNILRSDSKEDWDVYFRMIKGDVNMLRSDSKIGTTGITLHCSDDGKQLSAKPDDVVIHNFIGGNSKFTIRYDQKSQYYWTLANKTTDPVAYRNCLVLVRSKDLRNWEQRCVVLRHRDSLKHAWQYVDWFFEGENDIAFISRTGWDDSHCAHDANYLTFHRLVNFRELTEKDDAPWLSNQTK